MRSGAPVLYLRSTPPTREEFAAELNRVVAAAAAEQRTFVDVTAGDLHRAVGGYPPAKGQHHRMPQAVAAMRALADDLHASVLDSPPSGSGASLKIRYFLTRRS